MTSLSLQKIQTEYPEKFTDIVKHLSQPNCLRCGGMMTTHTYMDIFSDYTDFQFQAQHCIQCGEVIDPFILLNRLNRSTVPQPASEARIGNSPHSDNRA